VVLSDRTRGNEHKLKQRTFRLNIREHSFTVRLAECWHRLPGKVMEFPFLKIFRSHLDMVLSSWL